MTTPTDQLLAERGAVHGEFTEHATITQGTKDFWRSFPGWNRLSAIQKESLEMNAHKVGRILAGDPNYVDHWDDIAGYSRLVSQRIAVPKQAAPKPALRPSTEPHVYKPPLSEALRKVDHDLNGQG